MTIIALFPSPVSRPAARGDLAAAGPVEPSSSPDLAPGPTFSSSPGWRAGSCGSRKRCLADLGSDMQRRRYAAAIAFYWLDGAGDVPTLAFVPGIAVTGRYRMQPPDDGGARRRPPDDRRSP